MSTNQPVQAGPENAAVRKVIYRLAELDGSTVDPDETNLIEAANTALENVETLDNRVTELETRLESVEDRAPEPSKMKYDSMDKADKATVIQQKLRSTAEATNGKASMDYQDVISVFDGNPSPGHSYDILETAGEKQGYNYGTSPEGTKRLTVNLHDLE